ncbi:MAG: abortive infection protein [Deltaproteobacteria bacterium HGW-Deltaproteobacteria-22]|nr:MAG: abortive infection protein [Deltaproteobacteria bacterium HGW-Deltaproteobacteria-22]
MPVFDATFRFSGFYIARRGMLIEFEVGNFRSFRDPAVLSLAAAGLNGHEDNVFEAGRYRLLPSAALYGQNAAGKSNLLLALVFMRNFVLASSKDTQAKEPIYLEPFELDVGTREQPARFEVRFLLDGVTYRYGFEADRHRIRAEWLFQATKIQETKLFTRENQEIKVGTKFPEGVAFKAWTRENALFLSVVAQFNGPISTRILSWFNTMILFHGLAKGRATRSREMLESPKQKKKLMSLMKKADLNIQDLRIMKQPGEFIFMGSSAFLGSVHTLYDGDRRVDKVVLDFDAAESHGTKKFFQIAGPVLDALEQGAVMIVDEFDSQLHPLLSLALLHLFHSPETNPRHAQLIFATHDTLLLRHGRLRRDQIWFVEKDRQEGSRLYSLAEIKVRKDEAFDKNYLDGRYGAVPAPDLGNYLQDLP